ncbi:MAG: acylphosphatase [Ignavibacteriae bacterium]|nr:acylphosphatase [Ignavibacteriota bacterium]NOG99710.1 acylphosphatase [Ignavibacteriota bacterium]
MSNELVRAEILVSGLVQGVGFRYFVMREAHKLNLAGYVKNLYTGEVLSVVEGEKFAVEDFFQKLKVGPMHAHVKNASIQWSDYKNEFSTFEIKH